MVKWLRRRVLSAESRVRLPVGLFYSIALLQFIIMAQWSSGQDVAFSARNPGFDSLLGYTLEITHSDYTLKGWDTKNVPTFFVLKMSCI